MKLTTFTYHGTTRPGVVIGDEDLFDAAIVPDLPQDMIGLLEAALPPLIDCVSIQRGEGGDYPYVKARFW
jgi:hypothetical protein